MIEFIEKEHIYLKNGVIIPSVTTIIKETMFKDMYKNIPKYILKNAAEFGNNVHRAIEIGIDEELTLSESLAYDQWIKLKNKHNIKPLENETLVHYEDLYCGTLDMVAELDGDLIINDIKTTSKLDKEYLSWQLSFYKYAYENMHKKELKKAYATWLPRRDLGQFVEIEFKSEDEVMDLVKEYETLQKG